MCFGVLGRTDLLVISRPYLKDGTYVRGRTVKSSSGCHPVSSVEHNVSDCWRCGRGSKLHGRVYHTEACSVVCKVRFIVSFCCNTSEFPIILSYYNIFCCNKLKCQDLTWSVGKTIYSNLRRCCNKPRFITTCYLHRFCTKWKDGRRSKPISYHICDSWFECAVYCNIHTKELPIWQLLHLGESGAQIWQRPRALRRRPRLFLSAVTERRALCLWVSTERRLFPALIYWKSMSRIACFDKTRLRTFSKYQRAPPKSWTREAFAPTIA